MRWCEGWGEGWMSGVGLACVCANMRKYWWVRRWDECRCEGGVGAGAGRSGCRCEGVTLADYVGSLSDCAGVGGAVRPCHSDLAAPVLSCLHLCCALFCTILPLSY